ncbi:MAG: MaoC family dehydratase N-terminal domain-containing protein [Chloroflexi bacterium]|nr:MaoC family dehydratase N-terminal domain-containing protein [Chloroflexota bacterium]
MTSQGSVITQGMRDAIGAESEPVTYEVEKGALIRFVEAIEDPNPVYSDERAAREARYGGLIAPPTFFDSMISGPMRVPFENPYKGSLEGGSQWRYFEPVRPGDRITVTSRIAEIYERRGRLGSMLFVVREIGYMNQFGKRVAERRRTAIYFQTPEERSR